MTLEFSVKVKVKFRMDNSAEKIIQDLPQKLKSTDMAITPSGNNLFDNGNSKTLGKSKDEDIHTMVSKDMFLSKRERPKIQPMIAVLVTRVISPNIIY